MRALESALEVDERGEREKKTLEDVPGVLGRLEAARRSLGQCAEDVLARAAAGGQEVAGDENAVDVGVVERARDACGQLDDGGAAARAFVRWVRLSSDCPLHPLKPPNALLTLCSLAAFRAQLVISRLARWPSSTSTPSEPIASRPDLNALAQLVLSALPFGDPSNAGLRAELFDALDRADRTCVPPLLPSPACAHQADLIRTASYLGESAPAAPSSAESDALAAALLARARSLADAARAVPASAPGPRSSRGAGPSSASPSSVGGAVGGQPSIVDHNHRANAHLAPPPLPALRAHALTPTNLGPPAPAYPPVNPLLGGTYPPTSTPDHALPAGVSHEAFYDPAWATAGFAGAAALAHPPHTHTTAILSRAQQQQQQGTAVGKEDIARLYQLAEEVALAQAAAGEDVGAGPGALALSSADGGEESGGRRTRRRVG